RAIRISGRCRAGAGRCCTASGVCRALETDCCGLSDRLGLVGSVEIVGACAGLAESCDALREFSESDAEQSRSALQPGAGVSEERGCSGRGEVVWAGGKAAASLWQGADRAGRGLFAARREAGCGE